MAMAPEPERGCARPLSTGRSAQQAADAVEALAAGLDHMDRRALYHSIMGWLGLDTASASRTY